MTQVRRFLHRLGLAPRKVAAIPIPPKSTLEDHVKTQAEFLDNRLEPRLQEAIELLRQPTGGPAVANEEASLPRCVLRSERPSGHSPDHGQSE